MNSENFIKFIKAFEHMELMREVAPEGVNISYGVGVKNAKELSESENSRDENFRQMFMEGMSVAKVFEVEDDVKKLLCLTETPIKNDEIHLPFSSIFLDVSFTKEELKEYGVNIKNDTITGILVQVRTLALEKPNNIVGDALYIITLSQEGEDVVFDDFVRNINLTEDTSKKYPGIENIGTQPNSLTDAVTVKFIHKFVLNFLNFLNNPEVEYVEHIRSAKNRERRAKKGKAIIPSTMSIKVTGKLREYIDEAASGENWHFNYRFWVRGHFRDLKDDRYVNKKRIWILPYIKGKGILVDKTYDVKQRPKDIKEDDI
jgi:hypothetical protein